MATLPLDLRDVAATTGEQAPERGMDDAARIGHVHLNVADLDEAERFYGQVLGFDVTARGYPGALFLAAGGYHHHVGLNVWAGKGAPPPPAGAAGLAQPHRAAREAMSTRRRRGPQRRVLPGG